MNKERPPSSDKMVELYTVLWLLTVGSFIENEDLDIGPAGSRAMGNGLGYIRARAGSRCARVSSTYT